MKPVFLNNVCWDKVHTFTCLYSWYMLQCSDLPINGIENELKNCTIFFAELLRCQNIVHSCHHVFTCDLNNSFANTVCRTMSPQTTPTTTNHVTHALYYFLICSAHTHVQRISQATQDDYAEPFTTEGLEVLAHHNSKLENSTRTTFCHFHISNDTRAQLLLNENIHSLIIHEHVNVYFCDWYVDSDIQSHILWQI